MKNFLRVFVLLFTLVYSVVAVSFIVPGAVWTDTSGQKISAHGGHVVKVGSRTLDDQWRATQYLQFYGPDELDSRRGRFQCCLPMYRPKLISSNNKRFIWGQINRQIVTLVAPGTSPASTAYTVTGSPALLPPDARSFSDMGVFVDDDGAEIEAPGLMKASGVYYLIVSSKTGYRPDPNKSYWATSIAGPWSGGTDIAPPSVNTYNSQNTAELVIKGSSTTTYMFMGDNWDSQGTDASNYEWLPIAVDSSSHVLTLQNHAMWTVNVNTGVVTSSGFANTTLFAADAAVGGSAVINNKKRSVQNIDSTSNVTFSNVQGNGGKHWVSFQYTTSNATMGEAHVSVNGATPVNLSDLNSRAGHFSTVPVALTLDKGNNRLTFGVTSKDGYGFEAHLESIQVFDDY